MHLIQNIIEHWELIAAAFVMVVLIRQSALRFCVPSFLLPPARVLVNVLPRKYAAWLLLTLTRSGARQNGALDRLVAVQAVSLPVLRAGSGNLGTTADAGSRDNYFLHS